MISTRNESLIKLNKQQRYNQILDKLGEATDGLTAWECAEALGYTERNATAPRLTELEKMKRVKTLGTRYDPRTNRNVAVYVLEVNRNV